MSKRLEKYFRMKKILDSIEERPRTLQDILVLASGNDNTRYTARTIQYDLQGLKILGLIKYKDGTYFPTYARYEFKSKYDYIIALKHSENLLFSKSETTLHSRFDQMNPFEAVDRLVFSDHLHRPPVDDVCFVQHLRTGYFQDIYSLLKEYRQLMDDTGLSNISGFPKIMQTEFFNEPHPEMMISQASRLGKDNRVDKDMRSLARAKINLPISINREKFKEICDVRDLLVGKIYSVINDVRNRSPLLGYCDHCPIKKITINE